MISPKDVVDTVTTLIELGQKIRERYKIYSQADSDLRSLSSRLDASIVVVTTFQTIITKGLSGLRQRDQESISNLIYCLQGLFDRFEKQLSRLPAPSEDGTFDFRGKMRWTFGGKSGYEAILQELIEWRSDVHVVALSIKLLQDVESDDDRALYKQLFETGGIAVQTADRMDDIYHGRVHADPVFLPSPSEASQHDSTEKWLERSIPTSSRDFLNDSVCQWIALPRKNHIVYFESRSPERHPATMKESWEAEDAVKLGVVLQQVKMDLMHIVRCTGMTQRSFPNPYINYMYEIKRPPPPDTSLWSLYDHLQLQDEANLNETQLTPLNTRIRYAVELATAVMFTHAAGLVHKSIYPKNILVLTNATDNKKLSVFLAGFHLARLIENKNVSSPERTADHSLRAYQHPDRQIDLGNGHVVGFGIRHDMYSLGIVLLEIGTWEPLEDMSEDVSEFITNASVGDELDATGVQKVLIGIAEQHLPGMVGPKYAEAVLCCLRDSDSAGKSERDMREYFFENVLLRLKDIVV